MAEVQMRDLFVDKCQDAFDSHHTATYFAVIVALSCPGNGLSNEGWSCAIE
jgi:hypothetical protein